MDERKGPGEEEEEETGERVALEEEEEEEEAGDGFQVVLGKKKKRPSGQDGGSASGPGSGTMMAKDKAAAEPWTKAKVPFHDPSIPRPQDVYAIRVNNYTPFQHVWLEHTEDGSRRPIHPLEKLPVEQLIDRNVPEFEPVKPADLEDTPFTLVEDKNGLADLAKKLKSVNEFAVDLEHNQYRSFQGLTCLMQISTRTEDFVVDTLKLRIFIGLYLKEHFKDPTKRKVMHGADRDIMWLQRDFHIYVCNLFDTGQASRVLQMERNSLEHLLSHLCGVTANKEYQTADWRSRPLSDAMIKYAREDTHYLLYMYDLMKLRLRNESTAENDLLLEVQKRSNEICLQLYEKELLTDTSYLHIYGLQEHDLDAEQLAIVYALHQWRDYIAREEDESTGYVLPNKALIEIAKKMPTNTTELKRIVKSKYPFVDEYLEQIVEIIRNATESSYVFESRAEQLKKERLEQAAHATFQELKRPIALGALGENLTSAGQRDFFGEFSNKQAEKMEKAKTYPAFYYPHLPQYHNEVGHDFQSINRTSAGTEQPPAGNERGFQNPRRHQSFPPSGDNK
ncbi:protein RRP6-like 2 isoform X2 [Oryza brachyantha]|uniref:protein RRP6-like 2 isoform X2 n=1 Tax=Oryza brachyantha TaxID=4533 RepID=UPI00077683C1|nr:protein RRP6-like 2 isoform X2 [Oryza brachyantha]